MDDFRIRAAEAPADHTVYWIVLGVAWIACYLLALHVASEKRRDMGEATIIALVFGPFGVLILALLPTLEPGIVRARERADQKEREVMARAAAMSKAELQQALGRVKKPLKPVPQVEPPKPIAVECKSCLRRFEAPATAAGRTTKCPSCKKPIIVPAA